MSPDPFMIISILLSSMSETIYVVSRNPFVCFGSFMCVMLSAEYKQGRIRQVNGRFQSSCGGEITEN